MEGKEVGTRDKDIPWYIKELENVSEQAQKLLEEYSGIAPDRVVPHILEVRERAWDIFPYPCIGQFRFLDLSISSAPQYPEILQRVKDGQKLLDIGCCFGQDVRKLVFDGAPAENIYASDLQHEFWDLGYELFLDKDKLGTQFIEADVFDEESGLKRLDGQIDIAHAASFFHLFNWPQQKEAAIRIVRLLKAQKGSLILGRQVGNVAPGEFPHRVGTMYRHNEASFQQLWNQVGNATESSWKVEVEMTEPDANGFAAASGPGLNVEGTRWLRFTVTRE
ncbi:hypothetical protein H2201_004632 [Coniosporium apollinis]|uniref:Methyltransferase domain-containing protein n=2 Tax=Coniosporium TaxID=2810619 RepID=A0ABQ9NSG1_9PEZI|nr:hypothetical protein H2199_006702 [Cladosporium sp. JES 115]KAJ9665340.1 hypothetical protein H2201_004632 [Coniosporium apollinis]